MYTRVYTGGKTAVHVQIPATSAETRKLERSLTFQSRIDSLNEAEKMLEAKRKSRDSSYENVRESLQANRDRITSLHQQKMMK